MIEVTDRQPSWMPVVVLLGAVIIAAVSALPYAGGWNDGSRLAAVEAIADHHTLTIDDSIFVRVPQDRPPYPPNDRSLMKDGTKDKLLIRGHFYSDKPYIVSIVMAGIYRTMQTFGLPRAAERPDLFCRAMTLATSGLAYVVAVWSIFCLGRHVGLPWRTNALLTASFGLATIALPYARHVNNHILLLAVAAALLVQLVHIADVLRAGATPWMRLLLVGALAGVGYNLDLGSGPVLLASLLLLVCYRCRRVAPVGVLLLGLAPWLIAHHALNYAVGGAWKPMNAVPEYLAWPGSPFTPDNLTGLWRHSPLGFVLYALDMLFGKRGFVGHDLGLLLTLPAIGYLLFRRSPEWAEAAFAICWCGGTWLMYAAFSTNMSGACCSIRWFVFFLAPAYFVLALHLRNFPGQVRDVAILSAWGTVLGAVMWWHGPWALRMMPFYWPVVGAALLSWLVVRAWLTSTPAATQTSPASSRSRPVAA